MHRPPCFNVDTTAFWNNPYPILAVLRRDAPIALVPELGSILMTRRDDIFVAEKNVEVFSSEQPQGLMTRLMGQNMMRKDGAAHLREKKAIFPTVSPKTVRQVWTARFRSLADRIIREFAASGSADLIEVFAKPLAGECLKEITGLTNVTYTEIDAWSQAMIDGIANYSADPEIENRCRAATRSIDAAILDMAPVLRKSPNMSLLSVMMAAELPAESIHANIRLAISGGQNEPRDAIAGAIWALLRHPEQLTLARSGRVTWLQVFEEYVRWIAPIGMSPRRVAKPHQMHDVMFQPEDRVFFMFSSANHDEAHFAEPEHFDATRDTSKSVAFGAGPHFCAGAAASRAMVAEVALPAAFSHLPHLSIDDERGPVKIGGWAFRGLLNLPVRWQV